MLDIVDPAVVAVIYEEPHAWRRQSITLEPRGRADRIRRKLRLIEEDVRSARLLEAIRRNSIRKVLCNFVTMAVQHRSVWDRCDAELYVYCHGYDVTFDMRSPSDPDKPFHEPDYLQKALELKHRATFIANSHHTKELLIAAGFLPESIRVCYLGARMSERPRSHQASDPGVVTAIGRLVDFKSPDRTILAGERAFARTPGELHVFGDGPLRPMVELMRVRMPGRDAIHLHGAAGHDVVEESLRRTVVFTQHNVKGEVTNQQEAFGVAIVEAAAQGIPVVGTRTAGPAEIVRHGETGLLVEPADVDAQAEALAQLLADPKLRQRLGEAAWEDVRSRFSVEVWRENLRGILGESS